MIEWCFQSIKVTCFTTCYVLFICYVQYVHVIGMFYDYKRIRSRKNSSFSRVQVLNLFFLLILCPPPCSDRLPERAEAQVNECCACTSLCLKLRLRERANLRAEGVVSRARRQRSSTRRRVTPALKRPVLSTTQRLEEKKKLHRNFQPVSEYFLQTESKFEWIPFSENIFRSRFNTSCVFLT